MMIPGTGMEQSRYATFSMTVGFPASIQRVQRHMAEQGLRSVVAKQYNHHAIQGVVPDDKVNTLNGDFEAETIYPEMVYRYHLHPYTERRMDLSGLRDGFVQPQDYRICLWNVYDDGTGSRGSKECLPE